MPQMTAFRAAPSARRFSQGRHGYLRRQLRRRRDRQPLHLHERRQRTPDDDAAARARRAHGHRAHRADAGGPRRHAAGARTKRHRSEADGLLEHHHRSSPSRRRRRTRRVGRPRPSAHRPRRQRPEPACSGTDLAEVLYCIRCGACLECLSGLPGGRRPRVRQRLSRPSWRRADAGAARAGEAGTICRTPAVSAARAAKSVRSGSTFRACC